MFRIYLCGPINECSNDEACSWRDWFLDSMASNVFAPFHCSEFVDPMARDYRGQESCCYREIVDLDKRDLLSCNAMVAMCATPSAGTSMEILLAWQNRIPVVAIVGDMVSPWIRYHTTSLVSSKEEAAQKLREWMQ